MQHFRRSWLWRALFGGVVLFLLFGLFLVVEHLRGRTSLARYKRQLEARGDTLFYRDLIPKPPPGRNGFPALMAAVAQVREGKVVPSNMPSTMRPALPGQAYVIREKPPPRFSEINFWETLAADLEANELALEAMSAALRQSALYFEPDYSSGFSMSLSHVRIPKQAAQWLNAQALLHLHRGENTEALDRLQELVSLRRWSDHEPLLISQLVGIAVTAIGLNLTWEMLQAPNWTEDQLLHLQQLWQGFNPVHIMVQSLKFERALTVVEFHRYRSSRTHALPALGAANIFGIQIIPSEKIGEWITALDETFHLPGGTLTFSFNKLCAIIRDFIYVPMWQFAWSHQDELRHLKNVEAVLEETGSENAARTIKDLRIEAERVTFFDRLRFPVSSHGFAGGNGIKRSVEREVQRSLTCVACAIERYKSRHGTFPPRLDALVPEFLSELPADPWDGKSLRYRPIPSGEFLLYSVGEDREDNGGDPTRRETNSGFGIFKGRDVVWPKAVSPPPENQDRKGKGG